MKLLYIFVLSLFVECTLGEFHERNSKLVDNIHQYKVEKRAASSNACLRNLYVMAFTSGLEYAETDTRSNIQLQYNNGNVQTMTLYDRPGDDFQSNKGDLWEFSLSGCITLSAITSVSVVENGNDGWNIGSIVTLVRDPADRIQVLTQNFGVNRWIDGDDAYPAHRRFDLTLSTSDVNSGSCLSRLYIMAFTSGLGEAESDISHSIQIQLNGVVRTLSLYDRPGDDFQANKGDIWDIGFSSFGFSDSCIRIPEIDRVSIVENGNDGWNIGTIMTLVSDSRNYQVLTQDFGVNRWIDGDDAYPAHRRFDLNFADINECSQHIHGCSHSCTNTFGSYQCTCRTGYSLASDQRTCDDINECNANTDGCAQMCTNTLGSYKCTCRTGYSLASNQRACNDNDECAGDIDDCDQICTNTNGSFQCSCNSGYSLSSDERSCLQAGTEEGTKVTALSNEGDINVMKSQILVIAVSTVLFVLLIIIMIVIVTSTCIYLSTRKTTQIQKSSSQSTKIATIYHKNKDTKDDSCYKSDFQDSYTYECMT